MKVEPFWIEIDGCDPEVAAIIAEVFAETLTDDEEFQHKLEEIHEKALWQDYEDEHYNSPECNQ